MAVLLRCRPAKGARSSDERYDASRDPVALARLRADATEANEAFGVQRTAGFATLAVAVAAAGTAAWLLWPDDDEVGVRVGPGGLTVNVSF
ncbi:MAG: hypothetical protein R3F60_31695 [bacterium]